MLENVQMRCACKIADCPIRSGGTATEMQYAEPVKERRLQGFSIVELLITLVIVGILIGIASWGLASLRKREAVDSSVFTLQQDINRIRVEATKDGDSHRLMVVSPTQYALDRQLSDTWVMLSTKTLSKGVSFVAPYTNLAVESQVPLSL